MHWCVRRASSLHCGFRAGLVGEGVEHHAVEAGRVERQKRGRTLDIGNIERQPVAGRVGTGDALGFEMLDHGFDVAAGRKQSVAFDVLFGAFVFGHLGVEAKQLV